MNNSSLAHTKWECKYHVVFAPKYRRQIIYGKLKADIGKILRELCNWKGITIIEAEVCPDHVHMLIEIPPKYSVSGIMGYLTIDKINVKAPIFHGSERSVLQNGIGHMKGSSLPVDSPSSHVILAGHTGLPSAKLLTDLNKMEIGDKFEISVLKYKFVYEVDQIFVVEPNNTENLGIEDGKQFATLITCTPYGVNSHRLLVRGKLINNK